jgi:hypothetical protein
MTRMVRVDAKGEIMGSSRSYRVRLVAAAFALAAGYGIAVMDSSPTWDDAGVTAALIATAACIASLARLSPWIAAALVVAPLLVAQLPREAAVLLAIPFALAGAALGAGALHLGPLPPAGAPRA